MPIMSLTPEIQDYYTAIRIEFSAAEIEVGNRIREPGTPQQIVARMIERGTFEKFGINFDPEALQRLNANDTGLHAMRGGTFAGLNAAAVFYPAGDTHPHFHPVITFQCYAAPLIYPSSDDDADKSNGFSFSVNENQPDSKPEIVPIVHGLIQINKAFESHGFWAKRPGVFFPLVPESLEGPNTEKVSARTQRSFEAMPRPGGMC